MSLLFCGPLVHAADVQGTHVLIAGPIGSIVQRAIAGAMERLEHPVCALLLTEFHAPDGVPLAARLSELSVTPPEYLRTLWFVDGDDLSLCHQSPGPIAFTTPGGRVVYICGTHFVSMYMRNPAYAQVLVIHEMLHAAGLGENPPSSDQISRTAVARCLMHITSR